MTYFELAQKILNEFTEDQQRCDATLAHHDAYGARDFVAAELRIVSEEDADGDVLDAGHPVLWPIE
jgi:hypothetical protein